MASRLIATTIGSAMALAAFGLWPTREREQIQPELKRLMAAYASYVASLGAAATAQERREARNAVRVARANAEAALARLLGEPDTPPRLLERVQLLLANSNRLARTTMTLEAVLSAPDRTGQQRSLQRLIDESSTALGQIADAVGNDARAASLSLRLRSSQRELARESDAAGDGAIGAELAALSDRLVDNIDTLAHVLQRAGSN